MIKADEKPGRIVFLDHLRGFACLLVVFGHVYLQGINDPTTSSVWLPFIGGEPIFGAGSPGLNPFNEVTTWLALDAGISVGPLGVSIFFLISGYIILRTLDREAPFDFAIRRAFRIFPLSLFIASCTAVATGILCWRYGGINPNNLASVIANGFAAPGIFGTFSTLPVIWSLTVEVTFYALMGIASIAFGRLEFRHLALLSVLCGTFSIISQLADVRAVLFQTALGPVTTLGYCTFHIGYLLIGSALYRAETEGRGALAWVVGIGAIFSVTFALTLTVGSASGTGTTPQDSIIAFAIFGISLVAGLRWKWLQWFAFFGNISYPLYLIHIPAAWAIMFVLARLGFGMHTGTIAAISLCVLAAWILHNLVEMPAHRLGKSLTRSSARHLAASHAGRI